VPLVLSGVVLLTTIYLGWNVAKDMKSESWLRFFAIALASLDGTSFYEADLTNAIFTEAKLKNADFRKAILTRVCWLKAKMLDQARIENTYLDNLSLLQLLTTGEGQNKNFDHQDLRGVNLQNADLTNASFIKADLNGANLQNADLSNAKLIKTQLDEANLTGTTLTGACIEDWRINAQTNFKDVICEYVYLKKNNNERIPYDKNKKFKPGEFSKYVEKALNTVDLIFTDGIDWNAFLTSFKNLQDKYGSDKVGIQAIEKKPSGGFVIRVEVPFNINKEEIEKRIKVQYKLKVAELKQKYKKQLKLKDQDIEYFKKSNTDLVEILKLQAQKEPTRIVSTDKYYEQRGENITVSDITQTHSGSGDNVARDKNITNNYNSQDLPQAAAEIQQLLKQLSKTYPTTTNKEKIIVAGEAAEQIENNPTLKTKTINALKYAGKEAFKEAINHPVANILMAFIEGWQDTK
ncbi:MAG TPA: pentapeptide repeat-containing protein, partial [Xenococcaceae cyanobacterium]